MEIQIDGAFLKGKKNLPLGIFVSVVYELIKMFLFCFAARNDDKVPSYTGYVQEKGVVEQNKSKY